MAQASKDSLCNLQKVNAEWKIIFQKAQSKSEQLELIKKKVLADSVYFDYNAEFITNEVKYSAVDKNGNDCGCRIFFHLYSHGPSVVLNAAENPRVKLLLKEISEFNIDRIVPMFDEKAEKLYRTFGKCGAVLLMTNDKKLIRQMRKTAAF